MRSLMTAATQLVFLTVLRTTPKTKFEDFLKFGTVVVLGPIRKGGWITLLRKCVAIRISIVGGR